MVGILVISHGRLAEALISSVEFLVGNLHRIKGVSIWPKDQEKEVKDRIKKKMAEVNDGEGVGASEYYLSQEVIGIEARWKMEEMMCPACGKVAEMLMKS